MPVAFTLRRLLLAALALALMLATVALSGTSPSAKSATGASQPPATSRNWPMFGGTPQRNMVNLLETNLPKEWSIEKGHEKNIKWVVELGSVGYGGVVVAGGKIFIGTNNDSPRDPAVQGDKGILMCFRESDGQFLWQASHAKLKSGMVNDWPRQGMPSMPAIEGNRLWYVSNRCELVCRDTDGKLVWLLDMFNDLGVFPHNLSICSPVVVGDLVFVVTGNGVNEDHIVIPAPAAPSFLAVHKETGKIAWKDHSPTAKLLEIKEADRRKVMRQLRDQGQVVLHGQWSNAAYAEVKGQGQVIFPGGDGWLRAFEPATGNLLWKFDCNPKAAKWTLGGKSGRSDFVSTPVVHGQRLYIGMGQDPEHDEGIGHFWCLDLARAVDKGRVNKDHDVSPVGDNFDPAAPANQDSALAWHYGEPAPQAWKNGRRYVFGRTLSSAAVHDGLVYIAELGGFLHCLDAKTGQQLWVHDSQAPIWSSPYFADGRIYMPTDAPEVLIFKHGRKRELVNRIEMDQPIRSVPVAVNGVLYIVDRSRLYAIAEKK
jgi:outer membrane protein assembly factor BamB